MALERVVYPFTAIVGQDELKLALLLNSVNPRIGGVLIRGPKGTGKSTSVRALADLLPEITVVKTCRFNCSPDDPTNMCERCYARRLRGEVEPVERRKMRVVDLPIGATEDRVIGSLDIEQAIRSGIAALEPGLLAEANQNVLYIDEVNLLPDHITDDILDAAASGWNVVEREAVSVAHPARFILIGTMNPEEGELRPQLMDRFALHVSVTEILDEAQRVEIIRNNLRFGEAPEAFRETYTDAQRRMRERILQARARLMDVQVPDRLVEVVARACITLNIDGHRPDIVTVRSAKTLAAFEERRAVTAEDLLRVANMAIGFRTRREGFEEPATRQQVSDAFASALQDKGVTAAS